MQKQPSCFLPRASTQASAISAGRSIPAAEIYGAGARILNFQPILFIAQFVLKTAGIAGHKFCDGELRVGRCHEGEEYKEESFDHERVEKRVPIR
jgi:hypothetical protein